MNLFGQARDIWAGFDLIWVGVNLIWAGFDFIWATKSYLGRQLLNFGGRIEFILAGFEFI